MLTKAIIQSIDVNNNTCIVRIPTFETAGNIYKNESTAIFSIPPGIYSGFKVGDVVIVGFEDHDAGRVVVLGKLYLGLSEASTTGGGIICDTLKASNSVTLPVDTRFVLDTSENIRNDEVLLNSYSSISDITNAIKSNTSRINKIIDSGLEFSTVPQKIGKWLNQKDLYRTTIKHVFTEPNADSVQIKIDLENIKQIRFIPDYSTIETSKNNIFLMPGNFSNYKFDAKINEPEKTLTISNWTTGDYVLTTGYFTIEYILEEGE